MPTVTLPHKNGRPSPRAQELAYELAERKAQILAQLYASDPARWLSEQVKTRDEHDEISPVKRFSMKPYVRPMLNLFEKEKEPILLYKSRQMMMSWLACAYGLWKAQFFPHRLVLVISEKFEKSSSLVDRMRFMYENQEPWLKKLCPLEKQMRDMAQGTLGIANGSRVLALPEGPDQVRMHTASLAIIDEADFHLMFSKTYIACLPAVHGGGKLIVMSSVDGKEFSKLCGLI